MMFKDEEQSAAEFCSNSIESQTKSQWVHHIEWNNIVFGYD